MQNKNNKIPVLSFDHTGLPRCSLSGFNPVENLIKKENCHSNFDEEECRSDGASFYRLV